MRKLLVGLFILIAAPAAAQLGQGTQVYWNASRADAVLQVASTATTATTLTLTPAGGQSVYITSIDISNCAGATAVTAESPLTITTTNLGGLTFLVGSGGAAGTCQQNFTQTFSSGGYKAAAPGAATVVLPSFRTNQTIRVNVQWYSAP